MNPTESNLDTNATNTETTQINAVVTPPPVLEAPELAKSSTPSPSSTPNPGLTSFPSNEATPSSVIPPTSSPVVNSETKVIDVIAKKEVISRPLLWGVVTFLFFAGLVIGGVSLFRLYNERNAVDVSNTATPAVNSVMESTTPANIIDNTPENANTTIQADAIEAEIQAVDTDIETDALSDTQLGL